jgi:hypothetical protein
MEGKNNETSLCYMICRRRRRRVVVVVVVVVAAAAAAVSECLNFSRRGNQQRSTLRKRIPGRHFKGLSDLLSLI